KSQDLGLGRKQRSMKLFRNTVLPIAAGLLLSAFSMGMYAQDAEQGKEKSQASMTTMTGCLTKDASGSYMLTDETTGTKTKVSGVSDLEKHSANHKVTLTGSSKADAAGKQVLDATKREHVAP